MNPRPVIMSSTHSPSYLHIAHARCHISAAGSGAVAGVNPEKKEAPAAIAPCLDMVPVFHLVVGLICRRSRRRGHVYRLSGACLHRSDSANCVNSKNTGVPGVPSAVPPRRTPQQCLSSCGRLASKRLLDHAKRRSAPPTCPPSASFLKGSIWKRILSVFFWGDEIALCEISIYISR